MEDVYLVTMEIEKLNSPVGYFTLDEALRIKREMLETYRSMGFQTHVSITRFEKLPPDSAVPAARIKEMSAVN